MNTTFTTPSISLKKRPLFKVLIVVALFLVISTAAFFYLKYQLTQWLREQQIEIEILHTAFCFKNTLPSLKFEKLKISFQDPSSSLKAITANKIVISCSITSISKALALVFEFPYKANDLKVLFKDEGHIESKLTSGIFIKKRDIYTFKNISFTPLQFGFQQFSPQEKKNETLHLITYALQGRINYDSSSEVLKMKLAIPPATWQMPEGKIYSIDAKGEARLLKDKKAEVPFEGKLFIKIQNISNFLSHLAQIRAISLLQANIGTVIGYFSSRKNIKTEEMDELMKNEVTLEVVFKPYSVHVGPLQVYPVS